MFGQLICELEGVFSAVDVDSLKCLRSRASAYYAETEKAYKVARRRWRSWQKQRFGFVGADR